MFPGTGYDGIQLPEWAVFNPVITGKDEVVKESWAKVESQYQRRADFILNL
eukprot:gene5023-6411_t